MFKHKIIIIPVTKLENAPKPKHVVNDTYTAFINYYENICVQGVIFLIALILHSASNYETNTVHITKKKLCQTSAMSHHVANHLLLN
jgi:hypothetical protein